MAAYRLGRRVQSAVTTAIILSMVFSPAVPPPVRAAGFPAQDRPRRAVQTPEPPDLVVRKSAELAVDLDHDGRVEPGDTLRYTLEISNTGDEAQVGVLTDVLDPNVSLVPGSVEATPLVYDQFLSTREDTPLSLSLTGSDADGDLLAYSVAAPPGHGDLTGSPPDLTYTPQADFHGSDTFTFRGCDTASPPACDTGSVSITVTPINDPPSFSAGPDQEVLEDSGPQTVNPWAVDISPGPADESGQAVEFATTGNTNPSLFAAGPAVSPAGVLYFLPAVNAHGQAVVSLRLQDDGGTADGGDDTSAVQTFRITVTGVNDPPVVAPAAFQVVENTPAGTSVGIVTFTDPDMDQAHTFLIVDGNASGAFSIDPASGEIEVANTAALDYETHPAFTLTVRVTDDGSPSQSGENTISVTLNDINEAPVLDSATFTVDENSLNGTAVGTVTFVDPDAGQDHTFAIIAGNTNGTFAIDSTGKISVANGNSLDFETYPSFALTVDITDNGSPPLTGGATITIVVNGVNESPDLSPATFSTAENSPNGTLVGTVSAVDPDAGQDHSYQITGGNTGEAFEVGASTGEIRVATSAALDYETNPTFTLTVQVADNGTPALMDSATITIHLEDRNDAPLVNQAIFSLSENSLDGFVVGPVTASDQDAGDELTFAITAGNTGQAFAIHPTSGVLTVATPAAVDFETNPSFSLTIEVSDDGTPSLTGSATITVDLNDVNEAPVPNPAVFSLPENTTDGESVGTVTYTDPDAGQGHTFAITAGNTGGAFAIGLTGGITVANQAALNFEANPTFNLTVQVTDDGSPVLSGTAVVRIDLTDVNEAPTAGDDSYQTIGNTLLEVSSVPAEPAPVVYFQGDLLEDDADPDAGDTLTASLVGVSDAAVVDLQPDGSFTYLPAPGATGTPSFVYRVTDGDGLYDEAAVTITVKGMVWYVKNDALPGGLGRSIDPFDTLAEAQTASGNGATIYVHAGDGTTTGQDSGIALQSNQRLIGAGVALEVPVSVNGGPDPTLLLEGGEQPKIENLYGDGVSASNATGVEIRGLDISGAGRAILVNTSTTTGGTITVRSNTLSAGTLQGFSLAASGTGTLTAIVRDNAITSMGKGFDLVRTSGTVLLDFSNNPDIRAGGTGISIDGGPTGVNITITGFTGNSIHGVTEGTGISINRAIFDAVPGGTYNPVSGGSLAIGTSTNAVSGAGLLLTTVSGDLRFADLDIHSASGTGLQVAGSGLFTGSAGMNFIVEAPGATVEAKAGAGIDLSNTTIALPLEGFSSVNSPASGVSLVTTSGSLSAPSGSSISGAAGTAFYVGGGNPVVTYGGTVTNAAGRSVVVENMTGGSVDFNGAITDTGTGILLSNNNASTLIRFDGGLNLSTGSNPPFAATTSGILAVTGSTNVLTANAATALRVTNTYIHSDNLTFQSISSNGAANAVYLEGTGIPDAYGGLVVTGVDTTAGSGGSLRNATGDCIYLKNTREVSLANLNINTCGQMGIRADTVTHFELAGSQVLYAGDGNDEYGLYFNQLSGKARIENTTIDEMEETGIRLYNTAGALDLVLLGVTISDNDSLSGYGEDGLQFLLEGTGTTAKILVDGSTFTGLARDGIDGVVLGSAQLDLTVRNNSQFTNNDGFGGVYLTAGGTSIARLAVTGSTFRDSIHTPIHLVSIGTASLDAVIQGNTLSPSAAQEGFGIRLAQEEGSLMTVEVNGNTVNGSAYPGLEAISRLVSGSGSLHLTMTGNQVGAPTTSGQFGVRIHQQATGSPVCLDSGTAGSPGNNTFTGNNAAGLDVIRAGAGGFQIVGLAAGDAATVQAYLQSVNVSTTASVTGTFSPAATCRTPVLPVLPEGIVMLDSTPGTLLASSDTPGSGRGGGLAYPLPTTRFPRPSFDEVGLNLGSLPPGKTIRVTFEAVVSSSLPEGVFQVSNQAQVIVGSLPPVLSDDPGTPAQDDPTVVQVYRIPLARADGFGTLEDAALMVPAPGVLANDLPSHGYTLTAEGTAGPASGSLDLRPDGSFTYTPSPDTSGQVTFQYTASDGVSVSQPAVVTIQVSEVNDAPVLDNSGALELTPVTHGNADNPGTTVAALLASAGGNPITDTDPGALQGIAVIEADTTHGVWQYTLNGQNWLALSPVTPAQARLLPVDGFARLRFLPQAGWTGKVDPGITFRAWDRTTGVPGGTANTSQNGGGTAFSQAVETAAIQVVEDSDVMVSVSGPPEPVMAGTDLEYAIIVANSGPSSATDLVLAGRFSPGLSVVSASPGCSHTSDRVTCRLDRLAAGESTGFSVTARVASGAHGVLTSTFEVAAVEPDHNPANNTAEASITAVPGLLVYDSQDGFGDQWNQPALTTSPCGHRFLGEFGNQTVTLDLESLPAHTRVAIAFDLYILRSWDGNVVNWPHEDDLYSGIAPQGVVGPDLWDLTVDGQSQIHTTFSNWDDPQFEQAYPGMHPGDAHPPFTGASQVNSLCYVYSGYGQMDAIYRMNLEQEHTGSTIRIDFSARGLQGLVDESWGLDNVRVVLTSGGDLLPHKLYLPQIH